MLEEIGREFRLIVRNEFHIQIEHAKKSYTDIWPMKQGGLKVRLKGKHRWDMVYAQNFSDFMKRLRQFNYTADTDYARMKELENLMTKFNGKVGIFCDAGWKSGKARIAVVRLLIGGGMDVHIREDLEYPNVNEAELSALKFAYSLYPLSTDLNSDSQNAVERFNTMHSKSIARWVDRSGNKEADKLSNMRGLDDGSHPHSMGSVMGVAVQQGG